MQQDTTILQYLTFRENVSFNDPATPDGKLWNSALKCVTKTQGWGELHWGVRVASERVVDLLICKENILQFGIHTISSIIQVRILTTKIIAWGTQTDLLHFMKQEYHPFLQICNPLLLPDISIPSPFILQLHPGIPNLDLGTISSVYELTYDAPLNDEARTGLFIEKQLCRSIFMDAAEGVGDGFDFLNLDAAWVEPYCEIEPPSVSSAGGVESSGSGERDQHKGGKSIQSQTLLIIADWTSPETERLVSDCGRIDDHSTGGVLTAGEYFAKNILQTADRYTKHHVAFENVSEVNVAWLDKEEKWSTYVERLLAEEQQRVKK